MTNGKPPQTSGSVAALMQRGMSLAETYLIKGAGRDGMTRPAGSPFR